MNGLYPYDGMALVQVEPGTEILTPSGEIMVVDNGHVVQTGDTFYLTPLFYEAIKKHVPELPKAGRVLAFPTNGAGL